MIVSLLRKSKSQILFGLLWKNSGKKRITLIKKFFRLFRLWDYILEHTLIKLIVRPASILFYFGLRFWPLNWGFVLEVDTVKFLNIVNY